MINPLRASNLDSGILKYSAYVEPNEAVMDLLNRYWKNALMLWSELQPSRVGYNYKHNHIFSVIRYTYSSVFHTNMI